MRLYQLTFENYVIREDGAKIPIHESEEFPNENQDFLAYKDWLAQGNTPYPADPATEPVPVEVKLWQARQILHDLGYLEQVNALLDSLSEPHRTRAKNLWEYGGWVERDNQLVQMLAQAIPLSDSELDQMFIAANKLEG